MLFLGSAIVATFRKLLLVLVLLFPTVVAAEEVFIFVSFSMPEASFTQWVQQAKKVNAPILLQGLKNESLKETVRHLLKVGDPIPNNLLIDPERFQQFNIDKVPAVVISAGGSFDVVYGDISLQSALQKLSQGSFEHYARQKLQDIEGRTHG